MGSTFHGPTRCPARSYVRTRPQPGKLSAAGSPTTGNRRGMSQLLRPRGSMWALRVVGRRHAEGVSLIHSDLGRHPVTSKTLSPAWNPPDPRSAMISTIRSNSVFHRWSRTSSRSVGEDAVRPRHARRVGGYTSHLVAKVAVIPRGRQAGSDTGVRFSSSSRKGQSMTSTSPSSRQLNRRGTGFLIGLLVMVTSTLFTFAPVAAASTGGWSVSKAYFAPIQPGAVACSSDLNCIAGGNGLVTTANSGSTWTFDSAPNSTRQISAISCVIGGTLCLAAGSATKPYCCTAPLILRSTDSGASWANVAIPSGTPTFNLTGVSCPTTSDCVIAGSGGSLLSTDGGQTWTSEPQPPDGAQLGAVSCTSATSCIGVGTLLDSVTHISSGVAFSTTNLGASWTEQTLPGGTPSNLTSIACPANSVCYAGGRGGTVMTTNGGSSWTSSANSASLLTCSTSKSCVSADGSAMTHTTNGGSSWSATTVNPGSGSFIGITCTASGECFAVAYFPNNFQNTARRGEVFRSLLTAGPPGPSRRSRPESARCPTFPVSASASAPRSAEPSSSARPRAARRGSTNKLRPGSIR